MTDRYLVMTLEYEPKATDVQRSLRWRAPELVHARLTLTEDGDEPQWAGVVDEDTYASLADAWGLDVHLDSYRHVFDGMEFEHDGLSPIIWVSLIVRDSSEAEPDCVERDHPVDPREVRAPEKHTEAMTMFARRYSASQIAAIIYDLGGGRDVVAEQFAHRLSEENPRFDRHKFMAAAIWGIQERRRSCGPSPISKSLATAPDLRRCPPRADTREPWAHHQVSGRRGRAQAVCVGLAELRPLRRAADLREPITPRERPPGARPDAAARRRAARASQSGAGAPPRG
jgi:hypothetical protein